MKRIPFYIIAIIGIILIILGAWRTVTNDIFYILYLIVGIVLLYLDDRFLLPNK
ncbi:MAG: hypothetical protein GTN36_06325 [Candidatus Aenigmarchaeota archaeon]|nr:hypothetical protein [Candidatus Aenigmarchaeota archaeon]